MEEDFFPVLRIVWKVFLEPWACCCGLGLNTPVKNEGCVLRFDEDICELLWPRRTSLTVPDLCFGGSSVWSLERRPHTVDSSFHQCGHWKGGNAQLVLLFINAVIGKEVTHSSPFDQCSHWKGGHTRFSFWSMQSLERRSHTVLLFISAVIRIGKEVTHSSFHQCSQWKRDPTQSILFINAVIGKAVTHSSFHQCSHWKGGNSTQMVVLFINAVIAKEAAHSSFHQCSHWKGGRRQSSLLSSGCITEWTRLDKLDTRRRQFGQWPWVLSRSDRCHNVSRWTLSVKFVRSSRGVDEAVNTMQGRQEWWKMVVKTLLSFHENKQGQIR